MFYIILLVAVIGFVICKVLGWLLKPIYNALVEIISQTTGLSTTITKALFSIALIVVVATIIFA